jgi:aquaporin Z
MTLQSFRARFGKALMELIGTLMLVLTIQISVGLGDGGAMAPVAIGVVLIALVYTGGPVSGAHYNPSISLAIWLRGKLSLHQMFVYWIFQLGGGAAGALLGGMIGGNFSGVSVGDSYSLTQAFLAEVVFTFLLCFVVLGVATHSQAADNHYYGAAIGLVVAAGAITVGPISGGAFNPAVALGLALGQGFANLGYVLTVVGANLLGAVVAAAAFWMVAPDEFNSFGGAAAAAATAATAGETTNLV